MNTLTQLTSVLKGIFRRQPGIAVNYIDIGSHGGQEIDMLLSVCSGLREVDSIHVYGIEANSSLYEKLRRKYTNSRRVTFHFFNFAVSNKGGVIPLYLDESNDLGSSIYSTKRGVSNNTVQVTAKRFSAWYRDEFKPRDRSITIVKANIEGAEWDLISDLDESGLFGSLQLICASTPSPQAFSDIGKCDELRESNRVDQCNEILRRNNITVHKWSYANPQIPNVDMASVIRQSVKSSADHHD